MSSRDSAPPKSPDPSTELSRLLVEVTALRDEVERQGAVLAERWAIQDLDDASAARARNLAHYVILRGKDLFDLQFRLASHGLSSLGRSEARVLPALDTLIVTLRRLAGETAAPYPEPTMSRAGWNDLDAQAELLFGRARKGGPRAPILATLPSEAADDGAFVERLLAAGMDCARINCAHDDADAWARMIGHIRAAETKLGLGCRVLMDIAGPKCRIAEVRAPAKYRVRRGDRLQIVEKLGPGQRGPKSFTISFPEIISQLTIGAEVFIDDGKAAARVIAKGEGRVEIEIYAARDKGVRLKPDKGLNFPTTEIELSPLTPKDLRDLDFVAAQADLVGFSFVRRVEDIASLRSELAARRPDLPPQALVLKIETPLAVRNLPALIVQSLAGNPTAVMIARGDLALAIGFARLSEMQEEMLWICEAAHTPVIWATQVLDQFVREGVTTRSEMSDAAMAQGAECVMLNKGPHLEQGITFLRDVLTRMDRHHAKRFERYARLRSWS